MFYRPQMAIVRPASRFGGVVYPPGDKSISHRIGILASISSGITTVRNFLHSGDCVNLLRAMESMGARTHYSRDGILHIHGTAGRLMEPADRIDLGNSGTAMRLLSGLLAGYAGTFTLTGDESLRSRPMGRIREPLEKMGARVELLGSKGSAPVRVTGGPLKGIRYELPVASAQIKSCVLLAALHAEGTVTVIEPKFTRDHTERIFRALGISVRVEDKTIEMEGFGPDGPKLTSRDWVVPGDLSSAAFPIVAAAGLRRASLSVKRVGLNPRRTAVLDALKRMGARIKVSRRSQKDEQEPYGDIKVTGTSLHGTEIGGDEIPNLIDEIPVLAVAAAVAEGETVIRDASELRVKEANRITAMVENLRAIGVDVQEKEDGMVIRGGVPEGDKPVRVYSYGDHRIAMAMAVMALYTPFPVHIQDIACIETSYPDFWEDMRTLGAHVE